jgi:hypothetical protein
LPSFSWPVEAHSFGPQGYNTGSTTQYQITYVPSYYPSYTPPEALKFTDFLVPFGCADSIDHSPYVVCKCHLRAVVTCASLATAAVLGIVADNLNSDSTMKAAKVSLLTSAASVVYNIFAFRYFDRYCSKKNEGTPLSTSYV